jgi:NADPH:quinone reductase
MEGRENMKAIVVRESGGADKLLFEEVQDPTPGEGKLVVEVKAAGLNFIDTYHREGLYPLDLPFTPGLEGAGTVTDVGEGVDDFEVGDRVAWVSVLGSYAERHLVPAADAIPVPDQVDSDLAAGVMLQGITAHYLATSTFPLNEGDRCLVHAGAGGVGLLLTQIAKRMGAHVITTVGTEEKAELSRSAGADDVIVYTEVGFKVEIENRYGPNSLDVVYDGVGAATFDNSIDLLRPRGTMVTFGNASGPVPVVSPLLLAQKGSIFLTRPTMKHYMRTREELMERVGDLFDWVADGSLDVRIDRTYPLEEAAKAHQALEGRETTGKVLLHP